MNLATSRVGSDIRRIVKTWGIWQSSLEAIRISGKPTCWLVVSVFKRACDVALSGSLPL
jgi:hypothetical protein